MLNRLFAALALAALCLPAMAAKKPVADPREGCQYKVEYQEGKKLYTVGLTYGEGEAAITHFRLAGRKWLAMGDPIILGIDPSDQLFTTDSLGLVTIDGQKYALISYLRSFDGGKELSYAVSLIGLADASVETVGFDGRNLLDPSVLPDFKIEGMSSLGFAVNPSPALDWLSALIASDSRLVVLPEDVYMTDKAIEWWLENNPGAMGSAKRFEIGSVPAESSLAAAFKTARKEAKGKYQCAAVDTRGYTSLVVRNTSSGNYMLVWAVPACTNRATQWYLKNFYFENETTLAMIYYKGSSMAKIRLNLAGKTILR
ncbi:MAG: hypothetical protein J6X77_01700 [Bacteroidales bacterium]|nr:hypothetical protein [Bacteroidales bacterium]